MGHAVTRGIPSPRYYQVYVSMRAWVRDGTYRAGQQIPTEPALCAMFGVSRITVRKAVDELVRGPQFHAIVLFFWSRGRPDEAIALVERALRVDPGNLESRIMLADGLAQAGRLDEAIEHYQAIARDEPGNASPLFGLAQVYKRRGDARGAIDALRKAYELSGEEHGTRALATARTEEDYEKAEVAVARARLADLESLAQERYVSPLDLARLYAQVGERERAFASLEAALAERSALLVALKVERAWDRIRDDARFAALVRRVGIP